MNITAEITRIFDHLFTILNRQDNHMIILAVYVCFALAIIILRITTKLRFGGALMALRRDMKELKNRDDVKHFRNTLLRNTIAAYKRVADKAVTRIPTQQLVERQVAQMSILGWPFSSLAALIEGAEQGLLWVGLILAVVFHDFAHVYGVIAIVVFLLFRVCVALFDFQTTRATIMDELHIFIEREVGRFYASDAGGSVLRLKNELTDAQNRQTEALTAALAQLTKTLSDNNEQLNTTLSQSSNGLTEQMTVNTTTLHEQITASTAAADQMAKAGGQLQSASALLATHLQGFSSALSDQLTQLVRAIDTIKTQQDMLMQQSTYIEQNQQTLENTLHAYEDTLKNLTQTMGESLGAFVNVHAQQSAKAVNDALSGNITRAMQITQRGNNES